MGPGSSSYEQPTPATKQVQGEALERGVSAPEKGADEPHRESSCGLGSGPLPGWYRASVLAVPEWVSGRGGGAYVSGLVPVPQGPRRTGATPGRLLDCAGPGSGVAGLQAVGEDR